MAAPSTAPAAHLWYVQAGGQVWGPYTGVRMAGFIAEGRVGAATPVSPWRAGPFTAAREMMDGIAWPVSPALAPEPPSRPEPGSTSKPAFVSPTVIAEVRGPLRPLLVWATVGPGAAAQVQAALGRCGRFALLRPGLWLVQAGTDAAGLRNALSRILAADEALLVVEAPMDRAAWFNFTPGVERELRQFWGG